VITLFTLMAVGMGMVMAPATESVMGSLPREKAGVGSAVNDTTRQMGGALGVAIIGSIVASAYAGGAAKVSREHGVSGATLDRARSSLDQALEVGRALPDRVAGSDYVAGVKDAFVSALHLGLRTSGTVILVAAFVVWRFLPARAVDPLAIEASDGLDGRQHHDGDAYVAGAVAGD
jgi:hypothetical protein